MGRGAKLDYRQEAPPDACQKADGKLWYKVAVFVTGWGFKDVRLGGGQGLSVSEAGMYAALEALGKESTERIARVRVEMLGRGGPTGGSGGGKGKEGGKGEKDGKMEKGRKEGGEEEEEGEGKGEKKGKEKKEEEEEEEGEVDE